jgi:hypothetical protein
MSSTLTLPLQDAIDVAVVILDHCAAVSGRQAGTSGQHTVARVTGGWVSLVLGSERRKRKTEPRRVGVGEGGLWWSTDGQDGIKSERHGGLAERASGGGAVGGHNAGESLLAAGVGDAPLSR